MKEADFLKKNSVTKNYIYNLLYQILTIIIPLITTPYLSEYKEQKILEYIVLQFL